MRILVDTNVILDVILQREKELNGKRIAKVNLVK